MGLLISLISAAFSCLVNEWFPTAIEVQASPARFMVSVLDWILTACSTLLFQYNSFPLPQL